MSALGIEGRWIGIHDGDSRALALHRRHYSHHHYTDGRKPRKFVGPGEQIVLMTADSKALFVWINFRMDMRRDGQVGVRCSIFRNEGPLLSSDLILEAEQIAWRRWPDQRLYTHINARKIRSTNPGYCFLQAGWTRLQERTKVNKLRILEKWPI